MKGETIDDTDAKILNELLGDAKMPLRKVAGKLGVSFVTVLNRIKRLEKEGIITGYTAVLDYDKLGYDVFVLVELRISKGRIVEMEAKLAELPNVSAVYDTTGEFDAAILARFPSTRRMDTFLKKIQKFDFVERTNTKLILNVAKESPLKV